MAFIYIIQLKMNSKGGGYTPTAIKDNIRSQPTEVFQYQRGFQSSSTLVPQLSSGIGAGTSQSLTRIIQDIQIQTPISSQQPQQTISQGNLLQRQQIGKNSLGQKRPSISSISPTQLSGRQTKKNPYLGYMQQIQGSTQALSGNVVASAVINISKSDHSLEVKSLSLTFQASAIGSGGGISGQNIFTPHANKPSVNKTHRELKRSNLDLQVLQEASRRAGPVVEESKMIDKKSTLVPFSHRKVNRIVASGMPINKTGVQQQQRQQFNQTSEPLQIGGAQRPKPQQIISQPVSSRNQISSLISGTQVATGQIFSGQTSSFALKSTQPKDKQKIAVLNISQTQKQNFDLDQHIRGVIQSVERRKRKLSHTKISQLVESAQAEFGQPLDTQFEKRRQTLQTYSNAGDTQSSHSPDSNQAQALQRSRVTLSQSPSNAFSYKKQGSIKPMIGIAAAQVVIQPFLEEAYIRSNSLNNAPNAIAIRSHSLGKRGINVSGQNESSTRIGVTQQLVKLNQSQSTTQFKRRSGSSMRRDSMSSQHMLAHQSSESAHQNQGDNSDAPRTFSATQRSIKIYRNATQKLNESQTRRDSVQELQRLSQMQKTQRPSPQQLHNGPQNHMSSTQAISQINDRSRQQNSAITGFIDRTIKTSNSQFISPKMMLSSTSQQIGQNPIQFFNYQKGPFAQGNNRNAPRGYSVHEQFQSLKLFRNMQLRSSFKQWSQNARRLSFEMTRDNLCCQILDLKLLRHMSSAEDLAALISGFPLRHSFLLKSFSSILQSLTPPTYPVTLTSTFTLDPPPNLSDLLSLEHSFTSAQSRIVEVIQALGGGMPTVKTLDVQSEVRKIEEVKERARGIERDSTQDAQQQLSPSQTQSLWHHLTTQLASLDTIFTLDTTLLILDCTPLRTHLQRKLQASLNQLQASILQTLTSDTAALLRELSTSLATLTQPLSAPGASTISINHYIDQLTTLKVFTPAMLSTLHSRLSELSSLHAHFQPHHQSASLLKIEQALASLPGVLRQAEERVAQAKVQVRDQVQEGCLQMGAKIAAFERKYRERYGMVVANKEKAEGVIGELEVRGRMIEEIRAKVRTYQECIRIIGVEQEFKRDPQLSNFSDLLPSLDVLHQQTLQNWTNLLQWLDLRDSILHQSFTSLDIEDTLNKLKDQTTEESQDILRALTNLRLLRRKNEQGLEVWKPKHFKMLAVLKGFNKDTYTVSELIKIGSGDPDIEEIRHIAEKEESQWSAIRDVQRQIELTEIKYRRIYGLIDVIQDQEVVQEIMEESIIKLKRARQAQEYNDIMVEEATNKLQDQINEGLQIVQMLQETSKLIQQIEALFTNQHIQKSLSNFYKDYQLVKAYYIEKIGENVMKDPLFSSLVKNYETYKADFEQIINQLGDVQKAQENYFETRRLSFPRFFFMTNVQYLELVELAETNKDYNHLINQVFPGAAKLLLDQPINQSSNIKVLPPRSTNDLSAMDSVSYKYLDQVIQLQDDLQPLRLPTEVIGMISKHNELFTFDRPVLYDAKEIQSTFQSIEITMQQTVGHLISQAVSSFPKQSLDEWILDYPLQTILTTIHLILTHEINELFDDLSKVEHPDYQQIPLTNEYGIQLDYANLVNRTPDTRDLVVATASSQQQPAEAAKHHHQRTISLQQLNEDFMKNAGAHQRIKSCHQIFQVVVSNKPVLKHEEEAEEVILSVDEEWLNFRRDMFGHDFDIPAGTYSQTQLRKKHITSGESRDETMRILQEKSFRGLFLRLQFWINQICKSLQTNQGVSLSHSPVQKVMMQTIVQFLTYMRDVVFELKTKQIQNTDDFEWQKQLRLTWHGTASADETHGCRVDCGAWSTYQANEYLGNDLARLPLTPLTNKYFVFIAAALREKSAVLFRCMPTHDFAEDVFSEFSSLCTVPFKPYKCLSQSVTLKSLMQHLNGAALSSTWIFFEHVDRLSYAYLQAFNKEIQMVQQQFIIAELSQEDEDEEAPPDDNEEGMMHPKELPRLRGEDSVQSSLRLVGEEPQQHESVMKEMMQMMANSSLQSNTPNINNREIRRSSSFSRRMLKHHHQSQQSSGSQKMQKKHQPDYYQELGNDSRPTPHDTTPTKSHNRKPADSKVCFGVFASLSHRFSLHREKWADEIAHNLQSAFRVLSLTRPELPLLTRMLLKSEGFRYEHALAEKVHECWFRVQEELLMTGAMGEREDNMALTLRDLRRLVTVAAALMRGLQGEQQEYQAVGHALQMFLSEKLYSYQSEFTQKLPASLVPDLIQDLFKCQVQPLQPMSEDESLKLAIRACKPVCIVGKKGKEALVRRTGIKVVRVLPEVMGSEREWMGDGQQADIREQLGKVDFPLLSTLLSTTPTSTLLLFPSSFDLRSPYLATFLSTTAPLILIQSSLLHATPRLISVLHIIHVTKATVDWVQRVALLSGCSEQVVREMIPSSEQQKQKDVAKILQTLSLTGLSNLKEVVALLSQQHSDETPPEIDGDILVSGEFRRMATWVRRCRERGVDAVVRGDTSKTTFLRYIAKSQANCQHLPTTSFLTLPILRDLLLSTPPSPLYLLDDLNMDHQHPYTYLSLVRDNSSLLHPSHQAALPLPSAFSCLLVPRSSSTSIKGTLPLTLRTCIPSSNSIYTTKEPKHIIIIGGSGGGASCDIPRYREYTLMSQAILANKEKKIVIRSTCDWKYIEQVGALVEAMGDRDKVKMYEIVYNRGELLKEGFEGVRVVVEVKDEYELKEIKEKVPSLRYNFKEVRPSVCGESKESDVFTQLPLWISSFTKRPFTPPQQTSLKSTFDTLKPLLTDSLSSQLSLHTSLAAHYRMLLKPQQQDSTPITKTHLQQFEYLQVCDRLEWVKTTIRNKQKSLTQKEIELDELKLSQANAYDSLLDVVRAYSQQEWAVLTSKSKDAAQEQIGRVLSKIIGGGCEQPGEVARRLGEVWEGQGLNKEMRQEITKLGVYATWVNPKSIHGVVLEILTKIATKNPPKQQNNSEHLKQKITSCEALISIHHLQLQGLSENLEDLSIKEKALRQEFKGKGDIKESTKALMNEHFLKAIIRQGKRSEQKVDNLKIRLQKVEGDALMMAATVVHLAQLPQEERNTVRKELAESLLLQANIESSECWSNTESEQVHSKCFLKVIKHVYGLRSEVFCKLDHLVIDSVFAEFLFLLFHSQAVPRILDTSGVLLGALHSVVTQPPLILTCSSFQSHALLEQHKLSNDLLILTDLHDDFSISSLPLTGYLHSSLPSLRRVASLFRENPLLTLPSPLLHTSMMTATAILDCSFFNKNEAWIELKLILLKHFLPESHARLVGVMAESKAVKMMLKERQRRFNEQMYKRVRANGEVEIEVKQVFEEMRSGEELYNQTNQDFHAMINEHPLLASYSNIFVIVIITQLIYIAIHVPKGAFKKNE